MARAAVVQSLADCRKLTDNTARLACYDAAAAALETAEAKGDIVVVDREQARTVRRQAFGFHLPAMTFFERGEKPEQVDKIVSTIASLRWNGEGRLVVALPDGAIWAQIETKEFHRAPKAGMKVEIKQASLGSYMMSVDDMGATRVKRVE